MSDSPAKPFGEDYARLELGMRAVQLVLRSRAALDAQFIFKRVINICTQIKTSLCVIKCHNFAAMRALNRETFPLRAGNCANRKSGSQLAAQWLNVTFQAIAF
jgi:hypothetical protein